MNVPVCVRVRPMHIPNCLSYFSIGSTFSKAKPQVSWTYIAHKAVCRVVFYPLCYRW